MCSVLKSHISVLCIWKMCLESKNVACVALLCHFIVIIIYQHVGLGWIRGNFFTTKGDFKAHVRIKQVSYCIDFQAFHEVPKWVRETAENVHSGWRSFCAINVVTAEGILCPPDARRAPSGRPPGLPEGC